jgi:hypothetical protein
MITLSNSVSASSLLQRGKTIFDEVRAGRFEHEWCKLVLVDQTTGDRLAVMVSCDALKLPVRTEVGGQTLEDAHTRVNVDAFTQQEIADELGAVLLTPKLVDEIYRASAKLSPSPRKPDAQMASTAEMIRHSLSVDAKAAAKGASAPPALANVGKDWVISKKVFVQSAIDKNRSVNYGWLGTGGDRSVTGLPIIQSEGSAHTAGREGELGHTDYSQVARFAHRGATFNETPVDLALVYTGSAPGTSLVSHEGPLPAARLPQVSGAPPLPPGPPPGPPPEPPPLLPPPVPVVAAAVGGGTGTALAGGILGGGVGYVAAGPVGAAIGAAVGSLLALAGRPRRA